MRAQLRGQLDARHRGPPQGPIAEPVLWAEWMQREQERHRRATGLFAEGRGPQVLMSNPAWIDPATARQFALITLEYSVMGLYVAKEFCETALVRTIRASGRSANLAASTDSPYDLRGELHPSRLSASQLKTGMQEVEAHLRAREEYEAARRLRDQAWEADDDDGVARATRRMSAARRTLRSAEIGGRSERLLDAIYRLVGAGHTGNAAAIAAAREEVATLERAETFALEQYTHIAPVKDFARNPPPDAELAVGVHAAFRNKLREMMHCDDIVRVAGLPDASDPAMMIYEVTGVRLGEDDPLPRALAGVVRRGPRALRAVRNSRADPGGRITSWEADLIDRREHLGTLRLSTRTGMLHLTGLSAWHLREPIMRVRTPRPEHLRQERGEG